LVTVGSTVLQVPIFNFKMANRSQVNDPFLMFRWMTHIVENIIEHLNDDDLQRLASASPFMRAYVEAKHFLSLPKEARFYRRPHSLDPAFVDWPMRLPFTTSGLVYIRREEEHVFAKMLLLLQPHNDNPFWNTFAVVMASDFRQAGRAVTFLEAHGIFAQLSHGFPSPGTRKELFKRDGLAVLVVYSIGGEFEQYPEIMISLQPAASVSHYVQELSVGAINHYTLCSLDMRSCEPICAIKRFFRRFEVGNLMNPPAIPPTG
jgi:hypothetical protein